MELDILFKINHITEIFFQKKKRFFRIESYSDIFEWTQIVCIVYLVADEWRCHQSDVLREVSNGYAKVSNFKIMKFIFILDLCLWFTLGVVYTCTAMIV